MTYRYTVTDVRAAFDYLTKVCRSAGFSNVDRWTIQEGSQINGRAWRLYEEREGGGLFDTPFRAAAGGDRGYLGWTAKEATTVLCAWADAVHVTMTVLESRPVTPGG